MSDKMEKVKKRKRYADGTSNPSKRVAIEPDKQIKLSFHEAEKWAPIIVSTPGVAIPSSITLKPYTKARRNAPQRPERTGDIATKELLLHSSDHAKLDYIAREEEAGGADSLLKHYVGIYDPDTGKLEVLEARKMVARGSVRSQQATAEDRISRNMRDLRNDLGQTFGTKKARKAIASVTENAISPEKSARALANDGKGMKLSSADAAMIANMAETTKGMATRDDLAKAVDASKPRPKANTDAKNIGDVYTISNLIGAETFSMIPVKAWQDRILLEKKEVTTTSRFVSFRVANWASNVEKLKILRYMLFLIELLGACKSNRSNLMLPKREDIRKFLEGLPEAVFESVKRKFTDGSMMSKYQHDLVITHLCAMACIIDNYEVDTWDLKEDLKLETKSMSQYFNEIGAKIVALGKPEARKKNLEPAVAAQHKVAKLKLPLEFPKVSFQRRK